MTRLKFPAIVAVVGAMHLLLLYNAVRHNPRIGYDGREHLAYVHALAGGRLPGKLDSGEFFSPPLPYLLSAAMLSRGAGELTALKIAQISQVLVSLALVIFLLKICQLAWPGRDDIKLATVGLLGMLPVYYKTFAMIRGEGWVACFSVIFAYYVLRILAEPRCFRLAIFTGVAGGLLLLSRQWGVLVLVGAMPVVLVAVYRSRQGGALLRSATLAGFLTVIIGGWFYLHLWNRFGSVMAFNRPTDSTEVYPPQRLTIAGLFSDPIKESLHGEALPIFYSEMWGDYWCFFLVWGREAGQTEYVRSPQLLSKLSSPGFASNRYSISLYLARVNLLGLIPSVILFIALIYGLLRGFAWIAKKDDVTFALFTAIIFASIIGYAWFVCRTPSENFDTVKATYLLQIFPFLSVLAAVFVCGQSRRMRAFVWIALIIIAIHNIPACMTRYIVSY